MIAKFLNTAGSRRVALLVLTLCMLCGWAASINATRGNEPAPRDFSFDPPLAGKLQSQSRPPTRNGSHASVLPVAPLVLPPLTSFPVGWTALLNTTATGSSIEKTTGTQFSEDARARSTNLISSDDGFLEFQFPAVGKFLAIGLNSGRQAFYTFDMEFALSAIGAGLNIVEVREAGLYKGETTYTATDVFRIEISGAQVLYKKNGVTFYTNANPGFSYPYHADSVLFELGSRVSNAMMSAPSGLEGPLPPSNFTALSNSPTQFDLSWNDNSSNEAGFILERATTLPGESPVNWLLIMTSGPNVTTFGDSGLSPSTIYHYRLRSFNANGESVDRQVPNVLTSSSPTPTPTPTPNPSPTPPPGPSDPAFDVEWTALVNTTATGSTIEKTGGNLTNDARARSTNVIDSGKGFIECSFTAPGLISIGLNSGPQALERSDIEFALSTIGGLNIVEIREGGVYKGDAGFTASDVFRIEISGGQVLYKKNGVTFYTNASPALAYPYHGDAVLITPGVRASTVRMSVPPPNTPFMIMDENAPTKAAALDSVNFKSGPFPLINDLNFSADHRTRILLFAGNFDLLPGEDFHTVVSAHLTNQAGTATYTLPVEYVGKVAGFSWLTQIVVRIDEQVVDVGDLTVSLTLRGVTTNPAIITTKP